MDIDALALGIVTLLVGPGLLWHVAGDRGDRQRKDRKLAKFRRELRELRKKVSEHRCGEDHETRR